MYITVIDKNRTKKTTDDIDILFGADIPTEPEGIVRTLTYNIQESQITTDMMSSATYKSYTDLVKLNIDAYSPKGHYKQFKIPKKTHGYRTITAPDDLLKEHMKIISSILQTGFKVLTHDSAWAYTKGRDVVGAMQEHQRNESRWFLKLDLKSFFDSCSPAFIREQLLKLYPFAIYNSDEVDVVTPLSEYACYNGGLPQGTPLSPIITNLIMVPIDYEINKALYNLTSDKKIYKQRYIYTRYADDIIISAKHNFEYDIIIECIENILKSTPLKINKEKTRYGSSSGRNWNLGIMFNKDNELTIGYREKQKLKAAIHSFIINTREFTLTDTRQLLGRLNWLHNVQPDYYTHLIKYCKDKYEVDIITALTNWIKLLTN